MQLFYQTETVSLSVVLHKTYDSRFGVVRALPYNFLLTNNQPIESSQAKFLSQFPIIACVEKKSFTYQQTIFFKNTSFNLSFSCDLPTTNCNIVSSNSGNAFTRAVKSKNNMAFISNNIILVKGNMSLVKRNMTLMKRCEALVYGKMSYTSTKVSQIMARFNFHFTQNKFMQTKDNLVQAETSFAFIKVDLVEVSVCHSFTKMSLILTKQTNLEAFLNLI